MSRRYQDMVERVFEVRPGLEVDPTRVVLALAALGRPERGLGVCVHIGGTNGKGSCAAFVDAIARACGVRTGLFTSPHLMHFGERFVVDGQPLADELVLDAYERMRAVTEGGEHLSFFERITTMGLTLLGEARPTLTILEVGLGGRRDATNVVDAEVACVTGVALDHQDILGHDLLTIARRKGSIFKPGQRVVIGRSGEPSAVPVLIECAREAGVASLHVVEAPTPASLQLGLAGAHQRDNAAAALAIVEQLVALGVLPDDPHAHARGLANTRHPGRIERLASDPRIILDGAHNPHGAAALARELVGLARPRVLVLGMSSDKDIDEMLATLCPLADVLIFTRAKHSRSCPAERLLERCLLGHGQAGLAQAGHVSPTLLAASVQEALRLASEHAGEAGTIVVAGSLYLVGEARALVGEARAQLLPPTSA